MEELIGSIRDFNRFYVNLIGVLKSQALDLELSLTESRILYEIWDNEHSTAREIKSLLMIDEGYLSRTINKLVREKLVTKIQSTSDKRAHILFLTNKGKKMVEDINAQSDNQIRELLADLGSKEKMRVAQLMAELKQLLAK